MVFDPPAHPEISQFEHLVVNQDVVGFDVPMDQVGIVEYLVTFAELDYDVPNLVLGDQSCLLHVCLERALIAVLHDDIKVGLAGDVDIDAVDQVLMMRQVVENGDFCLDGLGVVGGEEGDDLDDQFPTGILLVIDSVDLAEGTLADLLVFCDEEGGAFETLAPDLLLARHLDSFYL